MVVPTKRNQREQPTEACLGLAAYVIISLGLGIELDAGCEAVISGFTIQIFHQMASYTIRQSYKILVCTQSFLSQLGLQQGIVSSYGSRRSYEILVSARRGEASMDLLLARHRLVGLSSR